MRDTHYYYRPPVLPVEAFARLTVDARDLIAATPAHVNVRGGDGFGQPTLTDDLIEFNGDRSAGLHCEPLRIERSVSLSRRRRERDGLVFSFCKTNGLPYDVVVVAVLYALIYRVPEVRFLSDSKLDELSQGFDLFMHALQPKDLPLGFQERPIADRSWDEI